MDYSIGIDMTLFLNHNNLVVENSIYMKLDHSTSTSIYHISKINR